MSKSPTHKTPHRLILGVSGSGKTTFATIIQEHASKRGQQTAVLDKMQDDRWLMPTYETSDPDLFLRYLKQHKNHFAFLEEAGTTLDKHDGSFDWFTTTGRHLGHSLYVSTHRYKQLSPTLRGQCQKAFLFACDPDDAKDLSIRYGEPELMKLADLPPLHFYEVCRFGPTKLYVLDVERRQAKQIRQKDRSYAA